jgi:HEAT repeat protein
MARVFISYIRENLAEVTRLAKVLRVYDIDVSLDRNQLMPGQRWRETQRWREAIREGVTPGDYFIACFSKEYSDRSRTYMNEELTLAIEKLRQRPADRAWFIPVLVSETSIPDRSIGAGETLRSLQWMPLYEQWHDGVARILSVVQPNSNKTHVLIKALESSSARERIQAIDSLGVLGPLANEAVPDLLMTLKDQNENVRAAAAKALGQIGIATEEVVTELLALMRRAETYEDSQHAAFILSHLGPLGVSGLLEATTFSGYGVGYDAFERAVLMGKAVLPHLIHIIESGQKHTTLAIEILGRIHDPQAIPDLVKILAHGFPALRVAAANAIGEVFRYRAAVDSAEAQSGIVALIEASEDPAVRSAAIAALGQGGRKAAAAVPRLIEALNDGAVRTAAIEALGRIGEDAAVAVPQLIAAVAAKETRAAAIQALGKIGEAANAAVPTLVTALNDAEVRSDAAKALGGIGPAAHVGVSSLIAALDDPDRDVRWNAVMALGAIGRLAYEAIPRLLQALQTSNERGYTPRVADALGKIGAQQAVEPLIRALSDKQNQVSAARALGKIRNPVAISALLHQSFDDDGTVRWAVIEALGDIGTPKDKDVVNRLTKVLTEDGHVAVRRTAARSLAKVGDPMSISALKEALNDKEELVRGDAQAAIDRLEGL